MKPLLPASDVDCRLCRNLQSPTPTPWDRPLFESKNFIVVPSVGSLVEGWLMIVTREHFLCAGALDSKALTELRDLKQTVKRHLEGIYGDIWCFEHGPSASGRSVGCGVDHAHVHAVPLMFDLLAAATPELPANVAWQEASLSGCQGAHRLGRDYLYVETPEGTTFLASGNDFQGQVFRRTIARESGCSGEYNWRDYPKPEVALRTIRVLRERADVASEVGIIDSPFS